MTSNLKPNRNNFPPKHFRGTKFSKQQLTLKLQIRSQLSLQKIESIDGLLLFTDDTHEPTMITS
ncbi:hypothetical protein T07_9575 [Trichinella nelsoni]|uniref:Uncharacterized protein n=1 Tax=Trichinella nelsoni TaxID=6336 RepID=A0A0V0SCH8_9BILA|nr:hypothetical protein T07_9575 [Trichinella nelsoni]